MTILTLGQGDTVGDKRDGSFARDVVSKSIRHEIVLHVGAIVEKGLRQLADRVISVNYGSAYIKRLLPRIGPIIISPQDAKQKIEIVKTATDMGVPVPEEHIYDQILGTNRPLDGDRAILFGETYIVGEEEPPSPREVADQRMEQQIKAKEEQKNESNNTRDNSESGSRSVANNNGDDG
jgi:hypothetical protein